MKIKMTALEWNIAQPMFNVLIRLRIIKNYEVDYHYVNGGDAGCTHVDFIVL